MKKLPLLVACLASISSAAFAADTTNYTLTIKDHKFSPTMLEVPAGQKIKLLVKNHDASAEEFESHSLKREKIVPANGEITVVVGPLAAGEYDFFGDFHEDTAKGKLVAK